MARRNAHLEVFICLLLAGVVWPVDRAAEAFEEQPWWRGNGMQGYREERAAYPDAALAQRDGRYWPDREGPREAMGDGYISGNRGFRPRPEEFRPPPFPQDGRGYGPQTYPQEPWPNQMLHGGPEYGVMRPRGEPYPRLGREQWNEEPFPSARHPVDDRGNPVDDRGYPPDDRGYPTDNRGYGVDDRGRPNDERRAERPSPWQPSGGAGRPSAQSLYSRNALLENRAGRLEEPNRAAFAAPGDRVVDDRSGPNGIPWR